MRRPGTKIPGLLHFHLSPRGRGRASPCESEGEGGSGAEVNPRRRSPLTPTLSPLGHWGEGVSWRWPNAATTLNRKNGNDHERGARVHPASPDLTVAVRALDRYSQT